MRRAHIYLVAVFLVSCAPPDAVEPASLRDALALYRSNRLTDALPKFEAAVRETPHDPGVHAWFAETARRQGRHDDALAAAREALAVDSCHAFAHTVLAALYQPLYSSWAGVHADSTWTYVQRAVACDPADGNAWIAMWPEALRRGDAAWEARALENLIATNFIPTSVLAYNRWVLEAVPPNALLLTNGDWDTFPALALQRVEGLRPDVAVVNLSMLNLPWYAALMRDRHDIPLALSDAALHAFRPAPGKLLPDTLVKGWRAQGLVGGHRRPLVAGATVARAKLEGGPGVFQEAGAFLQFRAEPTAPDTAAMRRALATVRGSDFVGSEVSAADRSPVRMLAATRRGLATVVVHAAVQYGAALREAGRAADVEAIVQWCEAFVAEAGLGAEQQEMIERLKAMEPPSDA